MAAAYLYLPEVQHRRRVPRPIRGRGNPLDNMSEGETLSRYRVNEEAIYNLCELLHEDLSHPSKRSNALPPMVQLLIALRFYASGSFQAVTGDVYTVSSSLSNHVNEFIKFPKERAKLISIKEDYFDIAGFPNVIGAVDGSLVPIKSPGIDDEYNYVCRKGYHAINIQGICDAKYQFLNIVAKWPGSTHDSFIWSNCQ